MSTAPTLPENLFARELVASLQHHQASLYSLTQAPFLIHPMTVYRLQSAANGEQQSGKTLAFPTLSPEDLTAIMRHYHFTFEEEQRIKAALLTNIVLVKLMARKPQGAIHITPKLFALFVQALSEDEDFRNSIESGDLIEMQDGFHDAYLPLLWRFDQASLAMHILTADWCENDERIRAAYEAFRLFHQLILDLYLFTTPEQQSEQWRYLHQSAQQQKEKAKEFLFTVGLEP